MILFSKKSMSKTILRYSLIQYEIKKKEDKVDKIKSSIFQ